MGQNRLMSVLVALKLIHVLSVIVAVGTNVSYAFWLRFAGTDRARLVFAINGIRWLDRRVANPLYIVVLITGILMVLSGPFSFEMGWIATAIILYVVVAVIGIAGFAPAMRRQLAEAERDSQSPAYGSAAQRSAVFGLITTAIVFVIVALMIVKPF